MPRSKRISSMDLGSRWSTPRRTSTRSTDACHRVKAADAAFGHRDASFATVIAGMWPDPADNEENIEWVRDYYDATAPHSEEGGYVNFAAGDDQDRVRANYGANYDRLLQIKQKYDPDNLFHMNQNITP